MKVIFLDVDGVLNSEQFWEEQTQSFRYTAALNEGKTDDEISVVAYFAPDAVAWVNYIVAMTNAEVVVSSTWRSDYNISFKKRYAGL